MGPRLLWFLFSWLMQSPEKCSGSGLAEAFLQPPCLYPTWAQILPKSLASWESVWQPWLP